MELNDNFKKYIDWKIYNITTLKNKYGFRLVIYFEDGTQKIKQIGGFKNIKEAKQKREQVITELNNGTFIVNENITIKEFFEYWLENIIKTKLSHNTYVNYSNAVRNHIYLHIENLKLINLNKGHIQKIYNEEVIKSIDVAESIKIEK